MERLFQTKQDYIHRKIAQVDVLIGIGDNVADFNGYITLNETAAFLWEQMSDPKTVTQLVEALTGEFAVEQPQAQTDVQQLLESLLEQKLIREVHDL